MQRLPVSGSAIRCMERSHRPTGGMRYVLLQPQLARSSLCLLSLACPVPWALSIWRTYLCVYRVQLQQSSREVLVVGRPCVQLLTAAEVLLKCSDLAFE